MRARTHIRAWAHARIREGYAPTILTILTKPKAFKRLRFAKYPPG